MRTNVLLAWGTVILFINCTPADAEFNKNQWKYFAPVEYNIKQDETLVKLAMTPDIFKHSSPGLNDIRFVNDEDVEIPFTLQVKREETKKEYFELEVYKFVPERTPLTETIILRGKKKGRRHINRIEISIPQKNFFKDVALYGSNNNKKWDIIVSDDAIYDFTSHVNLRKTRIDFPEKYYRYYKLVIHDIRPDTTRRGEFNLFYRGLFISSADIQRDIKYSSFTGVLERKAKKPVVDNYRVYNFRNNIDDRKNTVIEIRDIKIPAKRVRLDFKEKNFYRGVELYAADSVEAATKKSWRRVGGGEVHRVRLGKVGDENLYVDADANGYKLLKIEIINKDNPPVKPTSITLEYIHSDMVFLYKRGYRYRIFTGNESAKRPEYDAAFLLNASKISYIPAAHKEKFQKNTDYKISGTIFDSMPLLFPSIITVIVIVLSIWTFKLIKASGTTGKEV